MRDLKAHEVPKKETLNNPQGDTLQLEHLLAINDNPVKVGDAMIPQSQLNAMARNVMEFVVDEGGDLSNLRLALEAVGKAYNLPFWVHVAERAYNNDFVMLKVADKLLANKKPQEDAEAKKEVDLVNLSKLIKKVEAQRGLRDSKIVESEVVNDK